MRAANGNGALYVPSEPPVEPADLPRYLRDELWRISGAMQALAAGQLDETAIAPSKPRIGNVRLANGTSWNPGSGAGVYCYYGSAWHFLG